MRCKQNKEEEMTNTPQSIAPVAKTERIIALDVLRGFAIAGILIVNIQTFAMIEAAYSNPTAYGDLTGLNKLVWYFTHIFADLKFMAIFSVTDHSSGSGARSPI
jgi:uncharacterized protein